MLNLDSKTVAAVLEDYRTAPIPERLRAALRLLEAMTRAPGELTPAFLAEVKAHGLEVAAIEDAANVGFHFNLINRLADAFDFPLPDEAQKVRLARLLHFAGKRLGGKRPSPSFTRGDGGVFRPIEVEQGRARLLSAPGVTEPVLRRAVEGYAAGLWGASRGAAEVPSELHRYLEKLGKHAYKIIDEDVERLRAAGYGDEALYELTFAGAFGAAVAGLERTFEALHGAAAPEHKAQAG